jgi:hypothetical protein
MTARARPYRFWISMVEGVSGSSSEGASESAPETGLSRGPLRGGLRLIQQMGAKRVNLRKLANTLANGHKRSCKSAL